MELFKFKWLSSKERKELIEQNKILAEQVQEVSNRLAKIELERAAKSLFTKPYKSAFYTGNTITVVLNDGDVITRNDVPFEKFEKLKLAKNEEDIRRLLAVEETIKPTEDETLDKILVKDHLSIFNNHPDFKRVENSVYMNNVDLEIPAVVVSSFIEVLEKMQVSKTKELEDTYTALKFFWLKLALNPIEQSRKDLLNFVKRNDVKITKNGNLVLYRRVVSIAKENTGLVKFVSTNYYKVKSKWKKSPKDFFVYEKAKGEYVMLREKSKKLKLLGTLNDLYTNPQTNSENLYTSWYNRNKHTIRVGQIYQITEKEIDLNNGVCASGGLHAASVNYNYSGFGDTPVVVLVSPSKAITVPVNDFGKLRTTEMFVACVNDKPHGLHYSSDLLNAFDEEYNKFTVSELEEAISKKSFNVISVKNEVADINFRDLEKIKNILKSRIVKS